MNNYIIFLKGINVGGHKKILMADLRELLSNTGFKNVETYIQSGNIVLQSSEKSLLDIEEIVKTTIFKKFGYEVSVLAKTRQDLECIFDTCPFSEEKKKSSYFVMLHNTPSPDLIKVASKKVYEDEEYKIIKNCIYFFSGKGYGKAKFNVNYFEGKLNTFATARNYNTMLKLIAMSLKSEKEP
ncbi:DUF1697 domain-containing protein [Xanthomarina sp. F2636L]|uniref:DUF1697 domain-containing protein n=1 Tax=Xanthomarina sp. F2636L TaxID=2996018 RepID=UPI00225E2FC5|nr:DUF1697 domain-containing protein [Xanthomarina sp. F2636L]MCX7550925.1 DUF1697 domain-containing protein [Xanthomarina sp. F2636L]